MSLYLSGGGFSTVAQELAQTIIAWDPNFGTGLPISGCCCLLSGGLMEMDMVMWNLFYLDFTDRVVLEEVLTWTSRRT